MAKEAKKDVATSEKAPEVQRVTPSRALSPFDEMDRMFDSFFPRGWLRPLRWEWPSLGEMTPFEGKIPKVDVIDRDDEVLVRAEIPGVDKKDLDISMTENTVTIKGSTRREEKEEKGNYYRCEISSGAFTRTVALPGDVNADKAKATFKDGMLELNIPKVEKSKRRTIKVD
jgi:HSP20 family protein